jgi:probable addiction module antidote protein
MKRKATKRKYRTIEEILFEDLQDPEWAIEYLNAALMDEDPRVFLLALKDVYQARGQEMTSLARQTKLSRENLYRILSKRGNPKLSSIVSLLNAAGFSLAVQHQKK